VGEVSTPATPSAASSAEFGRCAVIGAGTMGTGIGYVLAAAGGTVTIVEPAAGQVDRSRAAMTARADKDRQRTAPEPRDPAGLLDRVTYVAAIEDLPPGLDLVVESVPERVELKRQVLQAVERRTPTLLGTNTSGLLIRDLAAGLRRPERLVGLHFFNPVWSTPLLEVVRSAFAGDDLVATARRLAEHLGKEAVVVADRPGFATTRLGVLLGLEAMRMLEDGVADVESVDRAMELGYRHPMGPLRLTDLIGLDVRLDIARHLQRSYGDRYAPPQILLDKVARGELGRKSGQGFYRWP
jgi:3-hydroxybutyryl-CoA dehydrogenase